MKPQIIAPDYYCYCLLDPRTPGPLSYGDISFAFKPFYVGKGRKYRAGQHFTEKATHNRHKANTIKAIIRAGLKPVIVYVMKGLSDDEAQKLEISLIAKIGRRDLRSGPLTNLTNGGDGCSGYRPSKESIEKRRPANVKAGKKCYEEKRGMFAISDPETLKEWKARCGAASARHHKARGTGIFCDPKFASLRSEWSKKGAAAGASLGGRAAAKLTSGKLWVHKGGNRQRVSPAEVPGLLAQGWQQGNGVSTKGRAGMPKGLKYCNNGVIERRLKPSAICGEWVQGRLPARISDRTNEGRFSAR